MIITQFCNREMCSSFISVVTMKHPDQKQFRGGEGLFGLQSFIWGQVIQVSRHMTLVYLSTDSLFHSLLLHSLRHHACGVRLSIVG